MSSYRLHETGRLTECTAGGRWPAPAKINRFLHIVGRRADGYHDLQTLFQFLDYGDCLGFDVNDQGTVRRSGGLPGLPENQDLAVRAARLLQRDTGTPLGVDIQIDKCIPAGGGLGGGSSDAATTLVALNALWGTGLTVSGLLRLGAQLGADVPVFVAGHAAFAEQRGDQLSAADPDEPWFVVLDPGVSVASARMYADRRLQRDCASVTMHDFAAGRCGNVFEPLVLADYPSVRAAHSWLSQFAPVRLSGSGGCLFAPFRAREEAQRVLAEVPTPWNGFVARGANLSPLQIRLRADED